MAEGFDNAKASTDLKCILKMNQRPQEDSTDSKNKRKIKKTEDPKKIESGYDGQSSLQRKPDRSKNRHTNSNGNALLDSAAEPRWPDFTQSVPRGVANSNVDQSVQKMTKRNNEQGSSQIENRSISAPMLKNNSENVGSFEVVNSNKRGFKNRKHLAEPEFVRNPKDSAGGRRGPNSSYNRNSSADKDQRRNHESLRNGDEQTGNFVKNRENYRSLSRGDKNHPQMNEGSQVEKNSEVRNSDNNSKPRGAAEPEEEELSAEFLLTLEENSIIVLKKKNMRFAKAKFYCELCDFHLNIKADCDKHMKEYRHSRKKKLNDVDVILKRIPNPDGHQLAALTAAVDKVYEKHGISEKEKKQRADVVVRLEKMLQKNVPDVLIFMYGSSLTGFGMKTADINVNLTSADKDKKLTLLLKETYQSLKDLSGSGFSNLRSDFTAKIPGFFVLDDATGLTVHVIIHCYNAHCSSELLSIYSDFDIRVRKLCLAFRYWAHLCGLDQKCDGFIAPQALNLMVIYFLQVLNPQLVPLIQPPKVTGEEIGDYRKDAPGFEKMRSKVMKVSMDGNNKMVVGELWFRLLQFYSLEFDTPNVVVCIHSNQIVPRTSKPWNSKKLAVEDPYMLKRNITRMVSNSRIYEYWEDSIRKAFHYFGFPRNAEGESYISIESVMKVTNDESSEPCQQTEVKADKKEVANMKDNKGDGKRDQSSGKEEDSSSIIIKPQKETTPGKEQTQDVTNYQGSEISSKSGSPLESDDTGDDDDDDNSEDEDDNDFCDADEQQRSSGSNSSTKTTSGQKAVSDKHLNSEGALATDEKRLSQSSLYSSEEEEEEEATDDSRNNVELPDKQSEALVPSAERDYHYEFSKDFLTDGKGPVLVCTYCDAEGHLKNACPEDKLPEVLPLPPLTPLHVRVLSETLSKVQSKVGLSPYDMADRVNFMQNLEKYIQGQFKDANLALFGSTCNGFGFANSDMDICLTFSYRKVIDKPWLVETLARKLKQCKELINVQAIPTAKVPIVKFFVRSIRLDGDISFYNILAQHNTKLLLCYSQIDHRVKILGYVIKNFAKVCDIGDASRGSLSSYAYILMMIYYLQQVTPPVIPVLQQLYVGKEKPRLMIDGCDAWFMEDLNKLGELWPEKGRNKMSIAELWLGFLRFYVEDFNYKELVVSIRQREPLTRFEKFWNGENIAVEDPFDVSHNLGSGLSRKMNNFIFKTFINGRMLYGSPIDDNMDMFKSYIHPYDYFFDTELLSENRPPNIRGCRHCGKMGHLAKRCPAAQKEKVEQKGLQKQQKQLQQQPLQQGQALASQQQPLQQGQARPSQQQPLQQGQARPSQQQPLQQGQARPSQQQPLQGQARPSQQQPLQQGQALASQQQKISPLLQDPREQQKQAARPHQQNQTVQGSQQQKQLPQPQQHNQPYQQAQQQKQDSQKQLHAQPSQSQQQQSQPETSQQQQSQPSNQSQENQLPLSSQQQQRPLLQKPQILPFSQQKQLSQHQHDRIHPQQNEGQRQPSQLEEQKQPSHEQRRRQPSQQEEHRQPPQLEDRRQLSQQQRRQPSQHGQPLQQEERKQPPHQEEHRQPPHKEERKQPTQQEERTQPPQQEKQRQPPPQQEKQRQPPPQQEKQRQSFEPEHLSQKEKQQTQSFQLQHQSSSQQQDARQHFQQTTRQPDQWHQGPSPQPQQQPSHSPQPQQQLSHSPQPQQQPSHSLKPQQQFGKPHHQSTQLHQPLQKNIQPFQQQRQTPPPPVHQQWQHPKPHQPTERELSERDEHHWQKGLTGNMNVNSSVPGFHHNFYDPRSLQAVVPTMMSNMPSQVYHNSSYAQQRSIHHQQHMPGGYRPNNSPLSSLGSLPPPLPAFPRCNAGSFNQRLQPSHMPNMPYPPGFHQQALGIGSGLIHANYDVRSPYNPHGNHYSGHLSRGNNNAGEQSMNPNVQILFDSARGQGLNDSSGHYYRPT